MPDPISAIASGVGAVAGLAQTLIGAGQEKRANEQLTRLFKQRKAFKTPSEIVEILQMEQNNAQTGFSAGTLDYLTSQADVGLSSQLGAATKLGADPNQIGGALDSYFRQVFSIGGESELAKMKKFDRVINATQLLAVNKEAEWQSRDNIIKDQMQAQLASKIAGQQNIQSGANLGLNSLSTFASSFLYDENGNRRRRSGSYGSGGDNRGGDPAGK